MSPQDLKEPITEGGFSGGAENADQKLRVLLVEDHGDTRMSMEILLRRTGYYVKSADSAAKALDLAEKEKFDLAITDIGLPDTSGVELMKQLSDRYGMQGIATSGYGEESCVGQEGGEFIHHLTKPIKMEHLRALLEEVRTTLQSEL